MTPTPPSESAHPPTPSSPLRDVAKAVGGLLLRTLLWAFAIAVAASVGGPLAVIGLSGVALLLALGLLLLGATTWRRAGLPLSLCAAAVALTAAIVAAQPVRISLSHGLLIAKPTRPSQVQANYRRGVGNVLIDLRNFAARPGSTTTINARSDTGRVVVALPRDRCFSLDVELAKGRGGDAVLFDAPLSLARSLTGYRTGVASVHGQEGAWVASFSEPTQPRTPTRLIAFGRTVFVPNSGGDQQAFSWIHRAPAASAPRLTIRADVATDLVVREYPKSVGPAFLVGEDQMWGQSGWTGDITQLSDLTWPNAVQLPPSPGDLHWRDRLQTKPLNADRARKQVQRWALWFKVAVAAAQRRSELGAGTCASPQERATYWSRLSWSRFGARDAISAAETYALAVNGIGERRLYRESVDGSPSDYINLKPSDNPFTDPAILKELAS